MIGAEDLQPQAPRRRNPLLWPVRFLLHWVIKLVVLVAMGIAAIFRPRLVRYGLVVVAALAFIGFNVSHGAMQPERSASTTPRTAAAAQTTNQAASQSSNQATIVSTRLDKQLPQSPVVERYLQAQANFDANGMWDTISDSLKQSIQQSNSSASPAALQQELDTARQQGRRYTGATYVGGMQITGGSSAYFYVLSVDGTNGSAEVPYIYVVGSDGKIESIQ